MRGYIESSYSMESVTGIFIGSLLGLIACAIVQLSFLHRTLANSPVSYGVPTYQTLLTVLTIISGAPESQKAGTPEGCSPPAPLELSRGFAPPRPSGGFFFDEFSVMPPKDFVWFSFGVAVSLAGVGMHTLHRATVDDAKGPQEMPVTPPPEVTHGIGDTAPPQARAAVTATAHRARAPPLHSLPRVPDHLHRRAARANLPATRAARWRRPRSRRARPGRTARRPPSART
jgi:hypothetical protein